MGQDNKTNETLETLAKKIWLAGLGAYGKSLNEAQDTYDKVSQKVSQEASRLFSGLIFSHTAYSPW